jgi:hypothetical protein
MSLAFTDDFGIEMSPGTVGAKVSSFGDVSFDDVPFGDVSFGNVSFGDVPFGDVPFGELSFSRWPDVSADHSSFTSIIRSLQGEKDFVENLIWVDTMPVKIKTRFLDFWEV